MTTKTKKGATLAEMKKANNAIEHYWFTKGAMEAFETKIDSTTDKWNMFHYSTGYTSSDGTYTTPRENKVAIFIPKSGKVFTVGSATEGLGDFEEAKRFRRAVGQALEQMANREKDIFENLNYIAKSSNTLTFYHEDGAHKFEIRTDAECDPARRIIG